MYNSDEAEPIGQEHKPAVPLDIQEAFEQEYAPSSETWRKLIPSRLAQISYFDCRKPDGSGFQEAHRIFRNFTRQEDSVVFVEIANLWLFQRGDSPWIVRRLTLMGEDPKAYGRSWFHQIAVEQEIEGDGKLTLRVYDEGTNFECRYDHSGNLYFFAADPVPGQPINDIMEYLDEWEKDEKTEVTKSTPLGTLNLKKELSPEPNRPNTIFTLTHTKPDSSTKIIRIPAKIDVASTLHSIVDPHLIDEPTRKSLDLDSWRNAEVLQEFGIRRMQERPPEPKSTDE